MGRVEGYRRKGFDLGVAQGKLEICGFSLSSDNGVEEDLLDGWTVSFFLLKHEEDEIFQFLRVRLQDGRRLRVD